MSIMPQWHLATTIMIVNERIGKKKKSAGVEGGKQLAAFGDLYLYFLPLFFLIYFITSFSK